MTGVRSPGASSSSLETAPVQPLQSRTHEFWDAADSSMRESRGGARVRFLADDEFALIGLQRRR